MNIPARAEAAVKGIVLWAGMGMAGLVISMAGLAFFVAAFYDWMASLLPKDAAAAVTGAALFLLAILLVAIGTAALKQMKRRQPSLRAEIGGLAGIAGNFGRIAGLIISKDPRKSLVLAVLAGAVAEYITAGNKRKH